MFSWRLRRQLFYFGIFAIIVFGVLGYLIWSNWPEASCFDKKLNQGEEQIDCGGPCAPCLSTLASPSVLWARFFKVDDGLYEVAALVENTHVDAGVASAIYRLKLFNSENILIALEGGRTFINPDERFVILGNQMETGKRIPARASVEFVDINWEYVPEYKSPNVVVVSNNMSSTGAITRLETTLRNDSLFPIENLYVDAVLLDSEGNAYEAGKTLLDRIEAESTAVAGFTWSKIFSAEGEKQPATIEIYTRTKFAN